MGTIYGNSYLFNWTNGSSPGRVYILCIGTTSGAGDLYESQILTGTTQNAPVPADGSTIYVTIKWSDDNGVTWKQTTCEMVSEADAPQNSNSGANQMICRFGAVTNTPPTAAELAGTVTTDGLCIGIMYSSAQGQPAFAIQTQCYNNGAWSPCGLMDNSQLTGLINAANSTASNAASSAAQNASNIAGQGSSIAALNGLIQTLNNQVAAANTCCTDNANAITALQNSSGSGSGSGLTAAQASQLSTLWNDALKAVLKDPDPASTCNKFVELQKVSDSSLVEKVEHYQSPTAACFPFWPTKEYLDAGTSNDVTVEVTTSDGTDFKVEWPTTDGNGIIGSAVSSGSSDAYQIPAGAKGAIKIIVDDCVDVECVIFGGEITRDDITVSPSAVLKFS